MKNIFNRFVFLIAFCGLFVSCSNFSTSFYNEVDISKGKGKICISTDLQASRSVLPTAITDTTTGLKWELNGTKDGTQKQIQSWVDDTNGTTAYKKMVADTSIFVDVGEWKFTLTASTAGKNVLNATISATINAGENSLNFEMQEAIGENAATGSIEFTLNFPKEVVGNVVATLYKYDNDNTVVDTNRQLTIDESSNNNFDSVKYSYPNSTTAELKSGYYILKIELQQSNGSTTAPTEEYKTINTYSCLVRVAPGLTSKGEYTLDKLAQLYTVRYEVNEGIFDSATTVTTSYNAYTSLDLPTPTKAGYDFAGWYTDENLQKPVQLDESNKYKITQDTTLYAKWKISWDGLKQQIENNSGISEFVITEDLTATSTITVSKPFKITSDKNVTITRGNSIDGAIFEDAFFKVESAGNLELEGTENITITLDGGNANESPILATAPLITSSGNLTLTNCILQNNTNNTGYGGGVYVEGDGTFNMAGGTISDCTAEQGGGVYVLGGTFTMTGGTISENKADYGGGIYVADTEAAQGTVVCVGQLTIEGGEISGNSAKYGGGVYIDSGDFTITGGKISENTSSIDGEGGGVYVKDGTFTIKNDALISKNTSCGNGGGVFAEGGNITINDGSISENIFSNNSSGGGGIYLTGTAQLTMTGGKISNNYPEDYDLSNNTFGGGVYVSGGTFAMTGGEISDNSAYYGGGVATIGTFSMSGGAYVNSNNDVYLANGTTITVTGNLTGITPVATITPNEYNTTRQVLVAGSADGATSSVTLSEQVGKFAVTSQVEETTEETINWTINANGCLELLYSDWSALKTAIEETSNTTSEFVLSGNLTATSTITVSGEITLKAPAGTTITRGADFKGAFFENKSTLTLEGITLDGSTGETSIQAEAPLITSSGSLTLNNCTLQNNNNSNATETGTGIYLQINDTSSLCSFNDVSFGKNSSDEIPHIKIENNTGAKFTFNLGGSLAGGVPSIDMPSTTCINITESLRIPDGESIKITLDEYTIGNRIISANEGINLVRENFSLTTTDESWFIDSTGYLAKGDLGEKPSTSETGEYVVSSLDNLLWIARGLKTGSITSFNIKLTEDIEIPSDKWQFYQLNVSNSSTIDGQGHSITIDEDVSKFGNDAGGLFYKLNNSTVKNLVLKGSIIANTSAGGYIGALCRSAYRTTIQNVMSTVEIIDKGSGNAGGLVGYFGGNGDKTTFAPATFIKNCAVYAKISSKNGTAGGLVGESWPNEQTWKIENCIYMGTVSSENGVAGALIGNENTGKTSYLTNIWYCELNNYAIFGKEGNAGNITQSEVKSKSAEEIASDAAATLLNTNSDETANVVWKYAEGDAAYPTLKSVN